MGLEGAEEPVLEGGADTPAIKLRLCINRLLFLQVVVANQYYLVGCILLHRCMGISKKLYVICTVKTGCFGYTP